MAKQVFSTFPTEKPTLALLEQINEPADLRLLNEQQLLQLADELREFLLYSVSQTGGHFGAGLGVIELTIALHFIYNTPSDSLVWDVGHQCYPHKILTGRRKAMAELRQQQGIAGFPKRSESPYDAFGVGHSSTSISAALGMAVANAMQDNGKHSVAVIGDGAMTAGMAFEALNHAAHTNANMLVVLNDNQMSISKNEGGLASYFAKIWASKAYTTVREGGKKVLSHLPQGAMELAKKTEEHMKGMVSPATLFEELGFNYIGPVDGHDLPSLLQTIGNMKDLKGPQLLHVFTQKGHGFTPAEQDPIAYHAISKIASPEERAEQQAIPGIKYQDVFGKWLCDMAEADERLVGITPAMREGSGMVEFSERFKDRYHDVAIAEQHAVTFAAGLACEGMKPVVAIYSTFLQRAYDQLVHDVAIQNLDVLFAIDRAGLVGEDGPTHAGSFDLSFLRCIPNMLIAAPSDEQEARLLLSTAYQHQGPAAVRYPRGKGPGATMQPELSTVAIGKAKPCREGKTVAILSFGSLLDQASIAAKALNASLYDMRFIKPIDEQCIIDVAKNHDLIVTLEENSIQGGAGSAVSECLAANHLPTHLLQLGLPDAFVDHGGHNQLRADCGLTNAGIQASIEKKLHKINTNL